MKKLKKATKKKPNINIRSTDEIVEKLKAVCEHFDINQREFIEKSIDHAFTGINCG